METKETKAKQQTRAVEALGRGFLISYLVKEGIGVSLPLWDDGIDLIVHTAGLEDQAFVARPLHLKVSTNTYVGLYEKYNRTPQTRIVFVWLNDAIERSRIFVMPTPRFTRCSQTTEIFKHRRGSISAGSAPRALPRRSWL